MTSIPTIDLSAQIEAEHQAALGAARSSIEHAFACGKLLIKAKEQYGAHGQWLTWVAANLSFGDRQARKYMRVAAGAEQLSNRNSGSDLSINEALELLAEPREITVTAVETTEHRQVNAPFYERQHDATEPRQIVNPVYAQQDEAPAVSEETIAKHNAAQRARMIADLVERMERIAGVFGPDAVEAAIDAYRRPTRRGDLNKVIGGVAWSMARPKGPTLVS